MMEDNFEQLVDALSKTPLSIDVLHKITLLIEQQTPESFSSFISHSFQSLVILKQWIWQRLSHGSHEWTKQPNYLSLFRTLASFNQSLIFNYDNIEDDIKASLLIPDTIDHINGIFEQIERNQDNNDPFIHIASLWFDNLSLFIYENPQFNISPVICHINQYIVRSYLMTDQFKFYLTQLQQPNLSQSIFSAKQLFYVKTCSSAACSYLSAKAQDFIFTAEEMLHYVGNEYLQIINIHSHMIKSWNKELSICIANLTGFIFACCWWGGEKSTQRKILFPTEQISCDFVQSLIRIISYEPFYKEIKAERSNDETILIENILKFLLDILQTQNIHWFFRSNLLLFDTLFKIIELSRYYQICLCGYAILGEILTDEKLKELTFADDVGHFFQSILTQGWQHPLKKYKQMPVLYLLRSFGALSKSDAVQQRLADSHKLSIFIEMCDQYSIVYDIIWALSFNQDIQQQLRSNPSFIVKLSHLATESDDEKMRKTIDGILWNLEINHQDRPTSAINDERKFDVMISYSHSDKLLCKQLYEELIQIGYRVWIDFDQMHGNVMDAMAQAIDQSQTIIICMSEQYRRSNYCRAEAHYAFQRQRKIVPVLLQKHYKPDGWLLFLIGQLLYVDFTKYEFPRAMEMLLKEIKATDIAQIDAVNVQSKQESIVTPVILSISPPKLFLPLLLPKNIIDCTQAHVQEWLVGHNLIQMSRLLADCDGRSLLYLNDFLKNGDTKQILNLLQEDSFRKTGQVLSLIELSCFRSLMASNVATSFTTTNNNTVKNRTFGCCQLM